MRSARASGEAKSSARASPLRGLRLDIRPGPVVGVRDSEAAVRAGLAPALELGRRRVGEGGLPRGDGTGPPLLEAGAQHALLLGDVVGTVRAERDLDLGGPVLVVDDPPLAAGRLGSAVQR